MKWTKTNPTKNEVLYYYKMFHMLEIKGTKMC